MNLSKIDARLSDATGIEGDGILWLNAGDPRLSLHGVYYDENEKLYMRVPDAVTSLTENERLHTLARLTAGGRIRFLSDTPFVAIRAKIPAIFPPTHMSLTASHGFSVYADGYFQARYSPAMQSMIGGVSPDPFHEFVAFETKRKLLKAEGKRAIEVYFPLYGGVSEIEIGVAEEATVEKAPPHKIGKPFVFYGSSITQGGCVSRPGNDYVSILSRRLGADYINLGFSGNGNAEAPMIDYVNSFDGSLYAFDYNMYADRPDRILPPHFSIYERIRAAHPNAVILMYDKPGYEYDVCEERGRTIRETYERALALGDTRVAYVPAEDMYGEKERDCCTIDGSHPNDLGAMRIADALYKVINHFFG